jgi:hypothetical protein
MTKSEKIAYIRRCVMTIVFTEVHLAQSGQSDVNRTATCKWMKLDRLLEKYIEDHSDGTAS